MRLKSLELHGYKTFASQTLFEFAGMITAVVGPNGSGKSNVADGLRWVLGEQSYSLLRGKKTEDMIFSGSEGRPRAGMASVSIVFDNEQGWLPIDFSEVSITRRAYRDGQNEYLINGQRVRLKDVTELLAQSGLAERTYTIIGQGVVDAALSLKAEERRRLFEEAAGIGLYRARREEALRRLETTQRNLERVQDILAELQPRLNSLERQARRAREYEHVRDDLRVLLRDWYGYHWHQAQQDLAEAREIAHREEGALDKVRQAYEQLDQLISTARGNLLDVRTRLNNWHRQMSGLHARREELSTSRAVDEERKRSLGLNLQDSQHEITRLEEDLDVQGDRLGSAQADVLRLQGELSDAQNQAEIARKALQARQNERSAAEASLHSLRQDLAALHQKQGELQARLAEKQAVVEQRLMELRETQSAMQKAQDQLAAARAHQQEAISKLAQATQSREQASQVLAAHRQRYLEIEAERGKLVEKQHSKAADLARFQAQLEVLNQADEALSGYARGAQALLQAARQGRLPGARGALGNLLEVPAELETAISAALGEYLDALVLDRSAAVDAGLGVLVDEMVRGVLLPIEAISHPSELELRNPDIGILGVASRLVKAPPELNSAVNLLLGRTWIVRDRETARRVFAGVQDNPEGLRAVTLKGEVFHASGPVISGGVSAQAALARPREMRTLQSEIDAVQAQIFDLQNSVHHIDSELNHLQEEERGLESALKVTQDAEAETQAAFRQKELAVETLDRQTGWHADHLSRLEEENRRGESDSAAFQDELVGLGSQISGIRAEIVLQEQRIAELQLDELQSQAAYWGTQVAVGERVLADARSRESERGSVLERAQASLETERHREAELQAALLELDMKKVEKRQMEADVNSHIEAMRVLIEPAEAELDEMERQQDSVLVQEASARQELSKAEHHHAQAKINLARRQEALETWRRRIEDDFGLVAFDYDQEVSGPTPLPLDGLVEQLPRVRQIPPDLEENMRRLQAQLRRIGPINPEAQTEFHEVQQRFEFMTEQVSDLRQAEEDVRKVITELDELMQRELRRTFDAVAGEFSTLFTRLFAGGSARLQLTDPEDMNSTGIEIEARLPGKRMQGLSLLSGGERSLTATALIFALLKVSPTPFCLLDEVDAMLDEANVGRFRELLRELSQHTQFIVVTHNRSTVQAAEVIYGVTMGRDSTSQVISLKMDEVEKVVD
jgi:chromosome segregation protein